ncbi:MAG: DUF4276 family protein [Thiotrichales bacterium]|nr:DUF4276 family protein [Thiotrichales bacterium]
MANTAMEVAQAGVVNDPHDLRWEIGEDPYVLGEALEVGAHWVASDNFKTLDRDAMEAWLDDAQREGRYTQVPRPFIPSAESAVDTLLKQHEYTFQCIPHEGKRDLVRSIPRKLRAWREPDVRFVVMRDQDGEGCHEVKSRLVAICRNAGRSDVLVRVVCRELEAWYLGEPEALARVPEFGRALLSANCESGDFGIRMRWSNRSQPSPVWPPSSRSDGVRKASQPACHEGTGHVVFRSSS